jgi:hypothetical protein
MSPDSAECPQWVESGHCARPPQASGEAQIAPVGEGFHGDVEAACARPDFADSCAQGRGDGLVLIVISVRFNQRGTAAS